MGKTFILAGNSRVKGNNKAHENLKRLYSEKKKKKKTLFVFVCFDSFVVALLMKKYPSREFPQYTFKRYVAFPTISILPENFQQFPKLWRLEPPHPQPAIPGSHAYEMRCY